MLLLRFSIRRQFRRRSCQVLAYHRRGFCKTDIRKHLPTYGEEHGYCRVDSVSVPSSEFPFRYGRLRRSILQNAKRARMQFLRAENAIFDVDHCQWDTQELTLHEQAATSDAGAN